MNRHPLNLLTALSLLLFAVVAVPWVRGLWISDHWQWADEDVAGRRRNLIAFESGGGLLSVRVMTDIDPAWSSPQRLVYYSRRPADELTRGPWPWADVDADFVAVRVLAGDRGGHAYDRFVIVPCWAAAAAAGMLPSARLARHWLRRRRNTRLDRPRCPVCDYDLRATPGRCPECGEGITIRAAW
jgi:hypothetical protein